MDGLNVANKNIKKNVTKTFNKVKKLSMPLKILVGFVLLLIIGLIVYFIYKAVKSALVGDEENPLLVPDAVDASDPANSMSVQLPKTSSSNSPNMAFTLSFWIYIADWYYRLGEPKAIMVKSIRGNIQTAAPGIWLAPNRNNLIITTAVLGSTKPQSCNIPNIPLQKWVHVAYVLDNRTTDVYINGKLERSCVLNNVPKLNNANLKILPKKGRNMGYLGQLSSVRYFSSALKPSDVVGIYQDGPYVTQNQKSTLDQDSSGDDDGSQCTVKTAKRLGELDEQAQQLTDDLAELQSDVINDTCPGSDRPCPPPPPRPGPTPICREGTILCTNPYSLLEGKCVPTSEYKKLCEGSAESCGDNKTLCNSENSKYKGKCIPNELYVSMCPYV